VPTTMTCRDMTTLVTVDDEDCHLLEGKNGDLSFNPRTGAYWWEDGKMVYVHRIIMGQGHDIEGKHVCFVSRDRSDCRRQNLFIFDPAVDPPDKKRKVRKERLQNGP
jgi:hypothetical protein